jgi:flagellar FliJ protein
MPVQAKTLQLVIDLAKRQRDQAALRVVAAQKELSFALDQQQQLQSYAQEAGARWQQRGAQGVSVSLLQQHHQFMAKIEHAIEFQHQVIAQKENRLAPFRQQLQQAERKLSSLEKAQDMQHQAQQLLETKREQKQMDEMAMSMLALQRRNRQQETQS